MCFLEQTLSHFNALIIFLWPFYLFLCLINWNIFSPGSILLHLNFLKFCLIAWFLYLCHICIKFYWSFYHFRWHGDCILAPLHHIYFLIPGDYPHFCPGTISPPGNLGTLKEANPTPGWSSGMSFWQEVGHDLIQARDVWKSILCGLLRKQFPSLPCRMWYEYVKLRSIAAILLPWGNLS